MRSPPSFTPPLAGSEDELEDCGTLPYNTTNEESNLNGKPESLHWTADEFLTQGMKEVFSSFLDGVTLAQKNYNAVPYSSQTKRVTPKV